MPKILIISSPKDLHAKKVIENSSNDTDYEFLDMSELGAKTQLSVNPQETTARIIRKNSCTDLKDIDTVWIRLIFDPVLPKHPALAQYILEEYKSFIEGFILTVGRQRTGKVFPNYAGMLNAKNKVRQLQTAQKVGLRTPWTSMGNHIEMVTDRFKKNNAEVLVKPFSKKIFALDGPNDGSKAVKAMNLSTRKIRTTELKRMANRVSNTPVTMQDYIEKEVELRITIVGNDIFTAAIDSQSSPNPRTRVDYRQDTLKLKHSRYELPNNIVSKLRNYMREMEMDFACVDMIVDTDGNYIFLESNPDGAWLWLEQMLDCPISLAIAKRLEAGEGIDF